MAKRQYGPSAPPPGPTVPSAKLQLRPLTLAHYSLSARGTRVRVAAILLNDSDACPDRRIAASRRK